MKSPLRRLFLTLAAIVIMAWGAATDVGAAPFAIAINTAEYVSPGWTLSIPVTKMAGADPVYGFDFLIQYDIGAMTLIGVTPGPIFDIPGGNEWENFSFRVDSAGGEPTGFARAVAVADLADGSHHPVDYHLPDDGVLFTLEFKVTADATYRCTWNPIWFYWADCGDNMLALDSLGVSLGVSDRVYQYNGDGGYVDQTDVNYGFPGKFGAPDECLSAPGVSRMVDFYGGGIAIDCYDITESTGDINCNGVAYEIADAVAFTNYFFQGLSAFGNHPDCSRQASDINFDGHELQWEDLIYLLRVVSGSVSPPTGPFPLDTVAVTFEQDDDAKTVTLDYPDSLAGIRLVFDGEITPTINIHPEGYIADYIYEAGRTFVLIMPELPANPFLPPQFVLDGPIVSYAGSALLIEANAADFNDRVFATRILSSGGDLEIPYAFDIAGVSSVPLGGSLSIPVVKTNGSEAMSGFDFLIGYDASAISITDVTPGTIFQSAGDYQWEALDYSFGPFGCGGECPSGLIRIIGLADTPDGAHHPLQTDIPDGTTLFTLTGTATTDPTLEDLFIPMRFFWSDCANNGVAFGATGDSLAVSDHVYDYDGVEITDRGYGLPGYYGAPDSCYANPDNPARFINFKDGDVYIAPLDSMKLLLSVDTVTVNPGDTDVYVNVYIRNPQDSIAGFVFHVTMSQPDLIQFGRSPSDDVSVDVAGTLTENWAFVNQQSLSGTYQDIRIYGISNLSPPYADAIPPGYGGLLCRLIIHAKESLPPIIEDSTVVLAIDHLPEFLNFSDPQGNVIGFSGGAYDPAKVSFTDGLVRVVKRPDGDANGDGTVNIADAVSLLGYIFRGGPAPEPLDFGDVNCDGVVNIGDAVYLIGHIFKGGPPPCSH